MTRSLRLAPLLLVACSTTAAPIFDETPSSLAWPPPPAAARIRYVGELTGSTDLKRPADALEGFLGFFFGDEVEGALEGPRSVVRSRDGRWLCVADPGLRCVHQLDLVDREYRVLTEAGEAPIVTPVGVCLGPGGSFYVCDSEGGAVHRFRIDSGAYLDTVSAPEELERPVAATYDERTEELYVVDVTAHDVKVFRDGALVRRFGRRGVAPGEFNYPCDIAADDEWIWVADSANHRIQGLSKSGEPQVSIGQAGDAMGDLALPKSVAVDGDGHLYVVDGRFENVQIFDRAGRLLLFFGGEGVGPGQFWLPGGIFIDDSDRIWICDTYNGRLQVFDYLSGSEVNDAP